MISNPISEIPVFGAVFQGLSDVLNVLGNIGADLSPAVREKAKKVVISAIIVTQVATTASQIASQASQGSQTGSNRKKST